MHLSALSSLHSDDAKKLQGLLRENPNGDLLVACASTSDVGQYAWISRRRLPSMTKFDSMYAVMRPSSSSVNW